MLEGLDDKAKKGLFRVPRPTLAQTPGPYTLFSLFKNKKGKMKKKARKKYVKGHKSTFPGFKLCLKPNTVFSVYSR